MAMAPLNPLILTGLMMMATVLLMIFAAGILRTRRIFRILAITGSATMIRRMNMGTVPQSPD